MNIYLSESSFHKGKWIVSISIALALGFISLWLIYKWNLNIRSYEVAIFLSPVVTSIVAFLTFFDYIIERGVHAYRQQDFTTDDLHVIRWTLFGMAGSSLFCFILTTFHGWMLHLLLMFGLFLIFFIWDLKVLTYTCEEKYPEQRRQIIMGDRLVNRPTLFAVGIIWLVMLSDDLAHKIWYTCNSSLSKNNDPINSKDVFAAGLVSFHLIVSAVGYFATTLGNIIAKEPDKLTGLKQLAFLIFCKCPPGPIPIQGFVRLNENMEVVSGATLSLFKIKKGGILKCQHSFRFITMTQSDSSGDYILYAPTYGDYSLKAEKDYNLNEIASGNLALSVRTSKKINQDIVIFFKKEELQDSCEKVEK